MFNLSISSESTESFVVVYCIEKRPKGFPSESTQMEQNPNSPMENFDLFTIPPAAAIRLSSTLQSLQGKYTIVFTQWPSPSLVPAISISAPDTPWFSMGE